MSDLKDIQENYKKMSIEKLIDLTIKPEGLRLEIIPILQQELISRGKTEAAMSLSEFLVRPKEKSRFRKLSEVDLKKLIKERLDSGESIESIKIDLKDDGVDFFNFINNDDKLKDQAFDFITDLKKNGVGDKEINQKLNETFSLEKQEAEILKVQLRKRGRQKINSGYFLLIIGLILIVGSLSINGGINIAGIVFIGSAIWKISLGHDEKK